MNNMKMGEKIKDEEVKLDPKWGEEDFSRMKDFCVSCKKKLERSKKRFLMSGNYCITCSFGCADNLNKKTYKVKPEIY